MKYRKQKIKVASKKRLLGLINEAQTRNFDLFINRKQMVASGLLVRLACRGKTKMSYRFSSDVRLNGIYCTKEQLPEAAKRVAKFFTDEGFSAAGKIEGGWAVIDVLIR